MMAGAEGITLSFAALGGLATATGLAGAAAALVWRASKRNAELVTKPELDALAAKFALEELDKRYVRQVAFEEAMNSRNERHDEIAQHVQALSNRVYLLQRKFDRHMTHLAAVIHMALSKQGIDVPPMPRDDDGPGG